jgi:hypothetical protein
MPKKKTSESAPKPASPRIAHVTFNVEREHMFVQYVKYLSSPVHIMWRNFLAGAFRGLGFVVGTTLLLTLMGFLTGRVLAEIPLFSEFAQAVDIWLENVLESN